MDFDHRQESRSRDPRNLGENNPLEKREAALGYTRRDLHEIRAMGQLRPDLQNMSTAAMVDQLYAEREMLNEATTIASHSLIPEGHILSHARNLKEPAELDALYRAAKKNGQKDRLRHGETLRVHLDGRTVIVGPPLQGPSHDKTPLGQFGVFEVVPKNQ